jgi:predicted DNA-binding transcriptional regulator AlpA
VKQTDGANLELIRAKPLAQRLGISIWTLSDWVRRGKFPPPLPIMRGAPHRWRISDVESWFQKCKRSRIGKQSPRGMYRQREDDTLAHTSKKVRSGRGRGAL